MFYPVSSQFTALVCLLMAVGLPVMGVMAAVAHWINWRQAEREVRRILREE